MKTKTNASPQAIASPQIIMEGIPYPGYESPLVTNPPLSRFAPSEDPNEATLVVPAQVSGTEGTYFAAIPTTEAMAPAHVAGEYVVFQTTVERAAADGDVVYAFIAEREIPAPRRWWQVWRHSALRIKDEGWENTVCIRRYGHDASGGETLTPIAEGFASWTAGQRDGRETQVMAVGVATSFRPWAQARNRRDGVWVARGPAALGYFPGNAVEMGGAR